MDIKAISNFNPIPLNTTKVIEFAKIQGRMWKVPRGRNYTQTTVDV